jgi:hypothetical protein
MLPTLSSESPSGISTSWRINNSECRQRDNDEEEECGDATQNDASKSSAARVLITRKAEQAENKCNRTADRNAQTGQSDAE